MYVVIFDGRCNLCTTLVQALERLDGGTQFRYVTMQDQAALAQWNITPADCEQGMILIQLDPPHSRWQGSDAAEEIARLFPAGGPAIAAYRAVPGLKAWGDRLYAQVRDHRYDWFGARSQIYQTQHPTPETPCQTCVASSSIEAMDNRG
ncbi:MAG: DCC1-like thiol-disulfide oxidoreductase family protein [Thermosynechococcaceae cyanobacterium]